jgi:hypothetical protein
LWQDCRFFTKLSGWKAKMVDNHCSIKKSHEESMLSVKRLSNNSKKEILKYMRNLKLTIKCVYFWGEERHKRGLGRKRRAGS